MVGLHTDLQMLFHPYPLLLYKLCHSFNKLGGGLHIPHMCGIPGSPVGSAMAGNWVLLGTLGACLLTVGVANCEGEGCASPMWLVDSGSPVASAMARNGVILGMLRACLSTVVATD